MRFEIAEEIGRVSRLIASGQHSLNYDRPLGYRTSVSLRGRRALRHVSAAGAPATSSSARRWSRCPFRRRPPTAGCSIADDPCVLAVRWFGNRYVLRVPQRRPFTPHEVRFARAIGSVLQARYRAILNRSSWSSARVCFAAPSRIVMSARSSTACHAPRANGRSERVAEVLEMMRVAALSSYENSPISTGVLLLEAMPIRWARILRPSAMRRTIRAR